MKLLTKTTLYISTLSLFLFFIMGIIFFHVLKNMSLRDLNRELSDLKEAVENQMDQVTGLQPPVIAGIDSLVIRKQTVPDFQEDFFMDTLMFDTRSGQFKTYRYLLFQTDHSGTPYQVKIFKSTTPADQLVERVTLMMTLMVILFLGGVFLMNRFVFANLWKDFFDALEKLREFDTAKEPVVLGEQDIEEFQELKQVLERMTGQLARDYRELKQYTDHTTHELQTPLAVIKSKTELLMQSENLGPREMNLIQAINTSTNQLSRLSSALALITRIENKLFTEVREIDLAQLLDRHLEMLQELIDLRDIKIYITPFDETVKIRMDEGLADILVANLLKNAIVHNSDGGSIEIEASQDQLVIANSGMPLPFPENEIFRRYVKNPGKGSGFGLGLSLAKIICESYGYHLNYSFAGSRHSFTIGFQI